MITTAFIGTFDPLHGGHVGQLLRAHKVVPFQKVYICVDKNPAHKPNASSWQHRLQMARLTLKAFDLSFDFEVILVENSLAQELPKLVDYKITGIDSLVENLNDPQRWELAQRWPMIVLSIPGIEVSALDDAMARLPAGLRKTIFYEYASETDVPMMNYDFSKKAFVSERVHATYLRAGKQNSLIPATVQEYIRHNGLY